MSCQNTSTPEQTETEEVEPMNEDTQMDEMSTDTVDMMEADTTQSEME